MKYSSNDIFIVTGASSGIGKGVALELNKLGASVIIIARNREKLEEVKKEAKFSANIVVEAKDLSNSNELNKWVLELSKRYGRLKGLVLSAGIQQTIPLASPLSVEESKKMFELNYFSAMQMAKGFCDRRVCVKESSSIVFVSSIASFRGKAGISGYSATKGALNSAMRSLAMEVARQKIRVNSILPGFVMTEMIEEWKEKYSEEYINGIDKEYPLGIGYVDDVVAPILFLLSNESKWITGTELVVDGGGSI